MMSKESSYYILENGIEKSATDDRIYHYSKLENGLTVVTIQDKAVDKAIVSMNVSVGYLSDPEEIPGLAHFVEHLLFMGTKEHPEENYYSNYLSKNNGSSNAFTGEEHTNFYFDVNDSVLLETLSVFSGFFTCPLFLDESVQRELNAVDSEHSKNLQNDIWRLSELLCSFVSKDHPLSKFGTGNMETLNLPDIREKAILFHKEHYHANHMQLVILSSYNNDVIMDHVNHLFCGLETGDGGIAIRSEGIYEKEHLGRTTVMKTIGSIDKLSIYIPLPSQHSDSIENSVLFLSHIIGDEGKGSILYTLRNEGYATALSSGIRDDASFMCCFMISISLTQKGLEQHSCVMDIVFSYLHMLQASSFSSLYEEKRLIANNLFHFGNKQNTITYVLEIALRLCYQPQQWILNTSSYRHYNEKTIKDLLARMERDNCLIVLQTRETMFDRYIDKIESIYKTEYGVLPNTPLHIEEYTSLHLPEANPFISSVFAMKDGTTADVDPVLIRNDPYCKCWYSGCTEYRLPKCCISILLNTSLVNSSLQNCVLTDLLIRVLKRQIVSDLYAATIASYKYDIAYSYERGLIITAKGFDEKIDIVIKSILEAISTITLSEAEYLDEYKKLLVV